jgi:phenylacetate-CoA ligase
MEALQIKRLRDLLKYADLNVPFYHNEFKKEGFKPEDVRSMADLRKIPTVARNEIQSLPLNEIMSRDFRAEDCIERTTSGSTGIPLTMFVDRTAASYEDALWARAFSENGLRLRDRMAVIRDPRSDVLRGVNWTQRLGIMRRKHISIFDDAETQLRVLREYDPDAIKSYTSSLAILADLCKNQPCDLQTRLIFTGAELLNGSTRKLISSTFGASVFDNYACNEFSLMAWECKEHAGYHVNVDNVAIEFVDDDGEAVAPGERGEIVCTTLSNHAMPLIRYRLGDVGIPATKPCACGITLPLMRIVEGRVNDFLKTLSGKMVSPLIFSPYPFDTTEGIKHFRVVQEKGDKMTIELVLKDGFAFDPNRFKSAERNIQKVFGEEMQVEFRVLEKIEKDTSGKLRKVVSLMPNNHLMNNHKS